MPNNRKDIAKELIENSGIPVAKIATELGFKNREALYYHFRKEKDISIDLFNRIKLILQGKGIITDKSINQTTGSIASHNGKEMILSNINGKDLHVEEHHHSNSDGLNEALKMAKDQILMLKKLLKKAEERIKELELEKKRRPFNKK
jgi:hypothetical protein